MAAAPSPISIDPTQAWEGNDGPWSTFFLGIGTPTQYFRVLISLSVVQPWIVVPEGCVESDPSDCPDHRGGLFNRDTSSTWRESGLFTLEFEQNLGYFDNGIFGFDTVSMGLVGTGAPTLDNQVLAGIASKDFYLGLWGLGPRPTNLTVLNNPYPSLMTNLKERNQIPSISYGYTAGAQYRKSRAVLRAVSLTSSLERNKVAGSLTLGGYDASRFTETNASFPFAGDVSRDLVVALQSISVDGLDDSSIAISLLPDPILTFIDAGVPQIWLPRSACEVFEKTFGLTYDPLTSLYLVNSTTHDALLSRNATLTFKLGADTSGPSNVAIQFPYAAFDLQLTSDYPGINETTHYFPIRRAANDTQYTLGRTFLQQAYIVADYERNSFSVNPCIFTDNAKQDLRSILPPDASDANSNSSSNTKHTHSSKSLSTGSIAGLSVGLTAFVLLLSILVLTFFFRRRRRQKREQEHIPTSLEKDSKSLSLNPTGAGGPGELHSDAKGTRTELIGDHTLFHKRMDGDGGFAAAKKYHYRELAGDNARQPASELPSPESQRQGQEWRALSELNGSPGRVGEMMGDFSRPSELGSDERTVAGSEHRGSEAVYELDSSS
ncbi:MAG: hypothetical protein Q9160_007826 [Pyrenula sp. 1 TL-2023]